MINDERQNGNNEAMMALTDIGYLSSTKNIGSEMELLRSRTIVEQVVKEMKLYITYQVEDNFAMRDLYVSSPVCVEMKETDLENLSYGFNFNVVQESDKVLQISGIIAGQDITRWAEYYGDCCTSFANRNKLQYWIGFGCFRTVQFYYNCLQE